MDIIEIIGLLVAIGIGLGCGSYATMPYWRLPSGEPCAGKWFGKRSHCVVCDTKLRTRDLLPVFNWLLTRGKCHFCGTRINPVYFFIEFSITLLSAVLYLKFGFGDKYLLALVLACCLVILTATDYSFRVMPDPVFVVMVMAGLAWRALLEGTLFGVVHGLALAILIGVGYRNLYAHYAKKPLENYSYLKMMALAAIWLPLPQFFLYLALAGIGALTLIGLRSTRLGFAFTVPLVLLIFLI